MSEDNAQAKFLVVARKVFDKVDAQLNQDTVLAKVFNFLKEKTGIKRSYFLSAIFGIVFLVLAQTLHLIWHFIGGLYGFLRICGYIITVVYPAVNSVKVLTTQEVEEIKKWLTYWCCISALGTAQLFVPPLHYLVEHYPTLKMLIIIGLLPTMHFNGSELVFSLFLKPFYSHVKEHSGQKVRDFQQAFGCANKPAEQQAKPTELADGNQTTETAAPKPEKQAVEAKPKDQ